MNSDEYLCWDLVPKSALVKFLPYERLVYRSDYPDDYFLRSEFIGASSLGDLKRFSSSPELLTVDQYRSRVWSIVVELTNQMYPVKAVNSFVEAMVERFLDPAPWGYELEGNLELRSIPQRMVAAKYASGVIQA